MNTEPDRAPATMEQTSNTPFFLKVLVWDAPTRLCHWLMAACFAGAYLTAEQDGWQTVHETLGYTMGALAVFRIFWGFVGTRHARFASFVSGLSAVANYLRELPHGWGKRHIGHSPAGALSVIAQLLLTLVVVASGWASNNSLAEDWWSEFHVVAAKTMLVGIGLHIAGVLFGSWRSGESQLLSMIIGTKLGSASEAIRGPWRNVALLLIAAVLGFWWYQWKSTTAPATSAEQPAVDAPREPSGNS